MTKKVIPTYMHIHVKDEISMTTYMNRRTYARKVPKWLPFENCVRITKKVINI